jgi:deglycase
MEKPLDGINVAILATDMFEEVELKKPQEALEEAGATTEIIAPKEPEIMAARHFDKAGTYMVDRLLNEADPNDYDALLLPGGALNADQLRAEPLAQKFVQRFDADDKPIAVICHAPWLLISAGLVKGRTLTSFHTIADDIKNAGGTWIDKEVVRDNNWVSSRQPDDIAAFNMAMIKLFAELAAGQTTDAGKVEELAFREQLSMEDQE